MMKKTVDASILFAFLLPPILLGSVFLLRIGIFPFGDKTILTYDLYYQYVEFYSLFRSLIHEGSSLLYSWQMGMGNNLIPWFAYYLMSPFSLIVLVFPENAINEAILLMVLLKVGCCGGFMGFYLRKVWNANGIPLVLFSCLYALMAFVTSYYHMVMILDAVYLLPLILFFTERINQGKSWLGFTLLLMALFITNFYAAFSTGIFVFLYQICVLIRDNVKKERIQPIMLRFFSAVILAAGCCGFLLVPTARFFMTQSNMIGQQLSPFSLNFNLIEFLGQLFFGAYAPADGELPNVYCGVLCVILLPLYLLNQRIQLRERIAFGCLSGILYLCMSNSLFDFVMHAFDRPNGYPFRYSWLFSFCLIFMAFRCFMNIEQFGWRNFLVCGLVLFFLLNLLSMEELPFINDQILMINIILCSVLAIILALLASGERRKIAEVFIFLLCLVEVFYSTELTIKKTDEIIPLENRTAFALTRTEDKDAVRWLEENDGEFYRVEKTDYRTNNDNMVAGYHSVANFSSINSKGLNTLLQMIGFFTHCQEFDLVYQDGNTPVSESLTGVRYILGSDASERNYPIVHQGRKIIFENPNALPLAFLADVRVTEYLPSVEFDHNPFQVMETVYTEMTGAEQHLFTPLETQPAEMENLEFETDEYFNWYKKVDQNRQARLTFHIRADMPGQYYGYLPAREIGKMAEIYLNGELQTDRYYREPRPYILDLGQLDSGEASIVEIYLDSYDLCLINQPYFYSFDAESFSNVSHLLQEQSLNIERLNDTQMTGSVFSDAEHILMTTIPFNEGWTAQVNGEPTPTYRIMNAFVGVPLTEGLNQISLEWNTPGLIAGVSISAASLFALLLIGVLMMRQERKAR